MNLPAWMQKEFVDYKMSFHCKPGQPYLFEHDGTVFLYYEDYDQDNKWEIRVAVNSDFPDGPWVDYPVLQKNEVKGHPDEHGIADPAVLYRQGKYHMWFDMYASKGSITKGMPYGTLGHAVSDDGIHWAKQATGGVTDTVVGVGNKGMWDDYYVHAPEAFEYKGQLRLLFNAQGTGHEGFDAGLAVAIDNLNAGTAFKKVGQVTNSRTVTRGKAGRVYAPFYQGDMLCAVVGDIDSVDNTCFTFIGSEDGGETWAELGPVPGNLWLHSFLFRGDKIWAAPHRQGTLYYLDLKE